MRFWKGWGRMGLEAGVDSKLLECWPPFRFWGPFFPSGARAPSLLPRTQLLRTPGHRPPACGTRDQGFFAPAAKAVWAFLASTGKGNAIYFYIVYVLSWSADSLFHWERRLPQYLVPYCVLDNFLKELFKKLFDPWRSVDLFPYELVILYKVRS